MVFLILNFILIIAFAVLSVVTDRRIHIESKGGASLVFPLFFVIIESILFTLVLIFRNAWLGALTSQMMRIIFCIDGIMFVSLSFNIMALAINVKKIIIRIIKYLLIAFVIVIVYWKFDSVDLDESFSIVIGSSPLFPDAAKEFFPWSWLTLYTTLYRYVLPITSFLFVMLVYEKEGTQLHKYQSILIGLSFVVMWVLNALFLYLDDINPAFSSLFMYSYLFMYISILKALTLTSIPSGRGRFTTIVKFFVSHIVPAIVIGFLLTFLQPVGNYIRINYVFTIVVISIAVIYFSLRLTELLSKSSKMYSADYEGPLEKALASIDYSGEMDAITNTMNEIFKKHVEVSSLNVYISNNKGELETAYASNGFETTLPINTPMFDLLLNIDKSVVCYSEIGNVHAISPIDKEVEEFFNKTNSDALFILNEGRNILGLITLGKKLSGDHYKDYDYNVFVKLYSYFFVFGYYMRNISNKDIISVVNREIKMSSQIITSIQENIDHIKNEKVDVGYLMVPAHNIGGEFIDFIRLTETRHLMVVGDLSGKGIAASMNMVILKSIIRTFLAETHDFKELVVKINSFIRGSLRKGTIFAGLFALIDFETDTMYYINCGVPTLMLYTQVYNNVIEIQGSGHILGFVKDISPYISVKSTKLNPGDIILACTDGMVQSHSLRGEQFGKERIQQCILDNSTYNAQRMVQFTFDSLTKFMSKEMEDDVSIVVMKYQSDSSTTTEDDENSQSEVDENNVEENKVEDTEVTAEASKENDVPENVSIADSIIGELNSSIDPEKEEVVVVQPEPEIDDGINDDVEPLDENESDNNSMLGDDDLPDLSNLDEMLKLAGI